MISKKIKHHKRGLITACDGLESAQGVMLHHAIWKQNIPRVLPYGAAFELDTVSIQDGELLLTIMPICIQRVIIKLLDSETIVCIKLLAIRCS